MWLAVAPPGPDQPEPGAVAGDLVAELLLDRRIDQDAIDVRQAGGEVEQGDVGRAASARDRTPRPSGRTRLGRFDRRPPGEREQRMGRIDIEPDVGVDAHLVADMPAAQRAAARVGDVADIDVGQPGRLRLGAKAQQRAMVSGWPQNALCPTRMVCSPGAVSGRRTAPAMHPAAWLPMMCTGPGAGVEAGAGIEAGVGAAAASSTARMAGRAWRRAVRIGVLSGRRPSATGGS